MSLQRSLNVDLHPLWVALRYSSAMPVRLLLAMSALLWAFFMVGSTKAMDGDPVYQLMFHLAPRGVWATMFGLDGLLLLWRLIDRKPRVAWTRAINASTAGLWSIYLALSVQAFGAMPPDAGDEIAILTASVWAALRSGLTVSDRESA